MMNEWISLAVRSPEEGEEVDLWVSFSGSKRGYRIMNHRWNSTFVFPDARVVTHWIKITPPEGRKY